MNVEHGVLYAHLQFQSHLSCPVRNGDAMEENALCPTYALPGPFRMRAHTRKKSHLNLPYWYIVGWYTNNPSGLKQSGLTYQTPNVIIMICNSSG